jgi:hypothetical protein
MPAHFWTADQPARAAPQRNGSLYPTRRNGRAVLSGIFKRPQLEQRDETTA